MPCTLRYGQSELLNLPLDPTQADGCFLGEPATPFDVRRATLDALVMPRNYPPLSQAIVSGDHVTLAVDRLVPAATEVAAAIVEHLQECGVPADAITVLFSEARTAAVPLPIREPQTTATAGKSGTGVHVEVHDPDDRGKLSYLTNTPSGKPIYLSRALGEADLAITIGAMRGAASWDYRGPHGGVYPIFSDRAAQVRFRNPALLHARGETFLKSQEELESIGWRSGAQFTVQVVPGAGDDAAAVLAGEISAVAKHGEALCASRHRHEIVRRRKTVIAALSGSMAQTWNQIALTLGSVLNAVEDGGVVALCTELAEPLGPALELLSQCDDDRDATLAYIRKERPLDMFAALQLAEAQRRVRIHLLSRLGAEVVESLGMSPLDDPSDIGRLAARGGDCLVVGDAQFAMFVGPE